MNHEPLLTPTLAAPRIRRSYQGAENSFVATLTRHTLHSTEVAGYYVRLFYLEEDDSFQLEWRLPDGGLGSKSYINPDDCYFSLRHCLEELISFQETFHPHQILRGDKPSKLVPRR